jgi:hypothetical protein
MNLFWTAIARKERLAAISEIQSVVNLHGSLMDVKPFSDVSLALEIEVEEKKLNDLYRGLENILGMDPAELLNSVSGRTRTVFLNISFPSGKGDLVHETPDVPG